MDIKFDKSFDVLLDDTNDLATVTGREKFEQRLRVAVTSVFSENVGSTDRPAVLRLLELQARKVAVDMNEIESVAKFISEMDADRPNTAILTIIYDTGETFSFSVSE